MAVYVCSQKLCLCLLGFLQGTEGGALPRRLNAVRVCARGKPFHTVFCDKLAHYQTSINKEQEEDLNI